VEGAPGRGESDRGIQDQIVDGETGVLLDDPLDLAAYGAAVCSLLDDPARADAMGREAKERVRHRFLGTRTLVQAIELYERHIRRQAQEGTGSH
jgi:trehalose synthase